MTNIHILKKRKHNITKRQRTIMEGKKIKKDRNSALHEINKLDAYKNEIQEKINKLRQIRKRSK